MTTQTRLSYTRRAEDCIKRAESIAAQESCTYVGSFHLLKAIRKSRRCTAMAVMRVLEINENALDLAMGRCRPPTTVVNDPINLRLRTIDFDQTLERAREEARGLGHTRIGTEHLLIAMLSLTRSRALRALSEVGIESNRVRWCVLELMGPDRAPSSERTDDAPHDDAVAENIAERVTAIEDLVKQLEQAVIDLKRAVRRPS